MSAAMQTQTLGTKPSSVSVQSGLLQRKCACGGPAGFNGGLTDQGVKYV